MGGGFKMANQFIHLIIQRGVVDAETLLEVKSGVGEAGGVVPCMGTGILLASWNAFSVYLFKKQDPFTVQCLAFTNLHGLAKWVPGNVLFFQTVTMPQYVCFSLPGI